MGQALLGLIPLALAAALSTVPVTAAIFILLSDGRRRSGLAFLGATLLGTFVLVTLATLVSRALPGRTRQHDVLVARLEIVIGVVMVLLGVLTLVRQRRSAGSGGSGDAAGSGGSRGSRWLGDLGSLGLLPVFGIGLALCLRPKAGLLALAAGLAINRAALPDDENLVLLVVYTLVATSTVVVPIIATILLPRQAVPRLVAAKEWLSVHTTTVGAAVMIPVGAYVIALGIRG